MTQAANEPRSAVLNMRIQPRILWLANVASRYRDQTLSNFIEDAIKQALSPEAVLNDEPNCGTEPVFEAEPTLWGDSLWDENEAVRVFRLAVFDSRLMTPSQKAVWLEFSTAAAKEGKKINQQNFVAFCNALEGGE